MIDNTTSTTVEIENVDDWLAAPGADSIIIPDKQDGPPANAPKNNIFSNAPVDLSFLDTKEDPITDVNDPNYVAPVASVEEILNDLDPNLTPEVPTPAGDAEPKKTAGRPKVEKSGLIDFLKKRIEAKEMTTFDDFDESKQTLDEYLGAFTEKDIDELWTANENTRKEELTNSTQQQFFESLPEELQYAAKYVSDGGTDLKGLFSALAHVEQVRALDPEETDDQEQIVRSYLSATNFGNDAEIAEQISEWKDLNSLGKKAAGFKPKLDKMQEAVVADTVARQEQAKLSQQQAAKDYMNNVFEALRPGEINGLKLDKTTQAKLYAGLTQPTYTSMSGRPTNLLGHLLEQHQFVKPNYELISEALWLLSDPDEYRKSLTKNGKNAATEEIARQLKTEQGRKNASGPSGEDAKSAARKIPRPTGGFLTR